MKKFPSDSKFLLLIVAIFTFLSLLLFWPVFLGKVNLNGNLLVSFYAPFGQNLPFKNTGWDQLRIYFPFYRVALDAIKNFSLPLWNPYAFSGHPHMADFQTAVFYPLSIFGLVLPQIEFWHLLRITPTILASFFTFLFLKNLRLSMLAAIFGSLTFGFSPFILTWGEEVVMSPHSIVWLPLILWAIDRYLGFLAHHRGVPFGFAQGKQAHHGGIAGRFFLVIIALSTASSFFGGYMQTTIYMFIFIFAYLILRIWRNSVRVNSRHPWGELALHLRILGSFGVGVGLAAVQLLPSAELYFSSARSQIVLRQTLFDFLLPIESLLTYLAPDFFGHPATGNFFRPGVAQYYEGILFVGVAALIFAAYAILNQKQDKLVGFLAIFGLVAASTTFDLPTARLFLSLPVPFLSTSIASRVLFIPAFCLSILAAIGLERWLASKDRMVLKIIFSFGVVYAVIILILLVIKFFHLNYFEHAKFFSQQNVLVSLRNLVVPIFVFGLTATLIFYASFKGKFKQQAAFLITILAFLHIFYFSQKYLSFSERKYVFPENHALSFMAENQGIFRSWGIGDAFLENNFASQYGIFWPEGYDSLNNRSYGEFTYAMQGNKLSDFVFRADAGFGRGKTEELLGNPDRRRLIDMVGIKYVVALSDEGEVMSLYNFKKVFSDGKYAVFENLQVMPRVFLASNYEGPPPVEDEGLRIKDEGKMRRRLIFQKLLDHDFDFRNVLILEKPSSISAQFGEGSAQIISYKPQEVVISTKSDQPKLLFLSDNYYPGWKARVDGEVTEILRADYTFRAVPLIPGEHVVRFYYDSEIFKLGILISAGSLGLLIFLILKKKLI
ncbi:hypothetical protein A3G16_03710 [Candidatus Curtissbacteria bacterium RIFCSPLOWO2_12_FULL_41_16]|nr:MAG: hypothetical protein A3G16_03710 [Candidatus Curtissbacteria bacterium RIFCSPLOWO2_12_FULL_41_16]